MAGQPKQRLDQLLVERDLVGSRTQAQALIMAGQVFSDGQRLDKPGHMLAADAPVTVRQPAPYVSRAGEKLASVAEKFKLNFDGKVVLDVGASTGGFTDFALQNRAIKVFSIDVGNGQLAWKLRNDPRVVSLEKTDIRALELDETPDLAVVDVSFISLAKVLPAVAKLIKPSSLIVALAKPQFEAGRVLASRYKGVISDEDVRQQVLDRLRVEIEPDFEIMGEADSAVAGAEGNVERFLLLRTKR